MTAKKKNKAKRAELERRALAIVADVREYDYDTRRALAQAAKDAGDKDLAAMLAQAEAGEIVTEPYDEIEEDYRGAAHATLRLMETDALPDFLRGAMIEAVNVAASAHGLEVWKQFPDELAPGEDYDGVGYSARALAELFRVTPLYGLDLIKRPTLAEHIAAVLADENTPTTIYNALAEAVTTLTARAAVTNSAEVIRLALKLDAEGKGGER
jgi:hypothetical protein